MFVNRAGRTRCSVWLDSPISPRRFRWPCGPAALSTLGGTFRVGLFIGPFVTAAILSFASIGAVYAFGALMSLATAILTAFLPDVTLEHRRAHAAAGEPIARWRRSCAGTAGSCSPSAQAS